jgi:nucleoside-diphosphate-sugar epimerase
LKGQSPYSASKIGADQIAVSFYTSFGTPVTIIRPFNTYGPRQSARAVIPTIIIQIAVGQRNIKLGAISPTRDFNFVEDTISGFLKIEKSETVIGKMINIGSNNEISIGDTANLIAELMKKDIIIETEKNRLRPKHSEVCRLWCENLKAKKFLKWQPKYSGKKGLKEGLMKTIEWFTDPEVLKKYKTGYTI